MRENERSRRGFLQVDFMWDPPRWYVLRRPRTDSTLVTTVVDIAQNGCAVESSQNGVNMGEGQTRSRDLSQVEDS